MRIANDGLKHARRIAVFVAIGTFMAIIKPYGATAHLPFWQGWMYWTGLIVFGSVAGMITTDYALKWLEGYPVLIILFIITSVTALIITPVLTVIHFMMGQSTAFQGMHILYIFVWVISAAMTGIGWLLHRLSENTPVSQTVPPIPDSAQTIRSFMSRLPLPYRTADLWAISSEDHYLRVHTSAGEYMFLERLSAVIHQLEAANGLQTHRSWWVCEQGVREARRSNGRITLILNSGVEVPVSRTFVSSVRQAGWV